MEKIKREYSIKNSFFSHNFLKSFSLFVFTLLLFGSVSYSVLAVDGSTVTITSPNGGENWAGTKTVTWNAAMIEVKNDSKLGKEIIKKLENMGIL